MPKAKLPYTITKVACGICQYAGRIDAQTCDMLRHARSKYEGNLFIKGSGFEPSGTFSMLFINLRSVQAEVKIYLDVGL